MNPERPAGKGASFVTREKIKSSASLLLKVRNEVVGVMFVNYRYPHLFLDREKQIIETFASSAAIAIQDARQWENLKNTQDQLVQSAKMGAVGTLASGIAHELKNPLANILSSINLLEMEHIPQEEIPEKLAEMKREVHRARDIIDSLLSFVRPREAAVGDVDILALVNEALNLLENQAKLNHINIESQLVQVPLIRGNATTLKQVFFNILRNAIEAMPNGGRLRVNTAVDNVSVHVEIQDTGVGIPPDHKSRIFEPFFTTKEAGYGTGLGLAISYAIVNDHHGDIKIISEVGKGSTFIVTLPLGE
jgi:two-component system NtrC family sensor kinase